MFGKADIIAYTSDTGKTQGSFYTFDKANITEVRVRCLTQGVTS